MEHLVIRVYYYALQSTLRIDKKRSGVWGVRHLLSSAECLCFVSCWPIPREGYSWFMSFWRIPLVTLPPWFMRLISYFVILYVGHVPLVCSFFYPTQPYKKFLLHILNFLLPPVRYMFVFAVFFLLQPCLWQISDLPGSLHEARKLLKMTLSGALLSTLTICMGSSTLFSCKIRLANNVHLLLLLDALLFLNSW